MHETIKIHETSPPISEYELHMMHEGMMIPGLPAIRAMVNEIEASRLKHDMVDLGPSAPLLEQVFP